ncbi:ABC transporter ATP-binding protein [uncultured Roseobacter sp.]|uniref:ABC transporter ATP-binding protein n=1 Tax=uncultured Roseobacter sp. TaxID=114847 RepID=UPI00262DB857|nr:ABC transporter ATP-binding protein [uncultured Roseobacter sp.]
MIEVNIESKAFGSTPVLGPIRFGVRAGETVALTGPSGIGKSTVLRILAGIDEQFEGTITRPDEVAFVFQEPTLLPWRSVLKNILVPHPRLTPQQGHEALKSVGLEDKAEFFPNQLSLGQQRRLSLARAFARTPELLIMDEPFVSLDAETADEMMRLTEKLIVAHQPAALFVTHDRREAERLADRVILLEHKPTGAEIARDGNEVTAAEIDGVGPG